MSTEHQLDQISGYFSEQRKQAMRLDVILEALGIVSLDMDKNAISAAMSVRGLSYEDGRIVRAHEIAPELPPKSDFSPFVRAAREAIDMATRPIPAGELIGMSGISTEALPAEGIINHLHAAGLYHIPGIGYWKYPQYANDRGELFFAPPKSQPARRMLEAFAKHGWPLAGEEIERLTNGEASSRFVSLQAGKPTHALIKSVGGGMFIPAGAVATRERPIPMTSANAEALIDADPAEPIFRAEDVRLYKLATILARHGLATVKDVWKVRAGRRQRAVSMELTEEGFAALKGLDRRNQKDEF